MPSLISSITPEEGDLAAPAHWDVVMKRPSLRLDDKTVSENGIIRSELPAPGKSDQ